MNKTLLVVDDNKNILSAIKLLMRGKVDEVITSSTPEAIPDLLKRHKPQVVLLDMNFRSAVNNGNEGLFWLKEIRRMAPSAAVVLFTAYADVPLAVDGMKLGAADFIVKPFENDILVGAIMKAFGQKKSAQRRPESSMVWGESLAMAEVRRIVECVSVTDANIVITGENGTGKDVLAREIHRLSRRADGPLAVVDMGAISESLFESELFGHVKGSFTDAKADRPGKFEAANGGTLFLDEIANLPYHLQAKLLTAIQQRSVTRLGSNTPRPVDIRLICATNRNIPQMVAEGQFRQDLYYRINTVAIELPPLRQRPEDIPVFAQKFLVKYANAYGKPTPQLAPDAIRRLQAQSWPGNIRQLEHVVEKALIMSNAAVLNPSDFDLHEQPMMPSASGLTLEDVEKTAIAEAMHRNQGNLAEVARQLGITRQTLYNKMRKYGI